MCSSALPVPLEVWRPIGGVDSKWRSTASCPSHALHRPIGSTLVSCSHWTPCSISCSPNLSPTSGIPGPSPARRSSLSIASTRLSASPYFPVKWLKYVRENMFLRKSSEGLYSLLDIQSVADLVRHGRMRWFLHSCLINDCYMSAFAVPLLTCAEKCS